MARQLTWSNDPGIEKPEHAALGAGGEEILRRHSIRTRNGIRLQPESAYAKSSLLCYHSDAATLVLLRSR